MRPRAFVRVPGHGRPHLIPGEMSRIMRTLIIDDLGNPKTYRARSESKASDPKVPAVAGGFDIIQWRSASINPSSCPIGAVAWYRVEGRPPKARPYRSSPGTGFPARK